MQKQRAVGLAIVAGLAMSAGAQESVSRTPAGAQGLPGDAVSVDSTVGMSQVGAYRVDLVPMFSSGGTVFGIAPIIKSPKSDPNFFNNLTSAFGMSSDQLTGVPFPQSTYFFWDQPSLGIHPTENAGTGVAVDPSNGGTVLSTQLAALMADFGGDGNNITSAIINFNPERPRELYITRVNTAINILPGEIGDSAQFGVGGIDASGNAYIRADGFGVTGPDPLTGDNYYHIDVLGRNGAVVNAISDSGVAQDATTRLVVNDATTHNTPTAFPASVAGGPSVAGSRFDGTWVRGFNTIVFDATHLDASIVEQRGNVQIVPISLMNGSVATGALLGKTVAGGNTDSINIWDIDATGNVLRTSGLTPPVAVSDPVDAYTVDTSDPLFGAWRFEHYRSQVSFRGGNGPAAVGRTIDGMGIAASTAYLIDGLGSVDPFNAIVAAHFDPADPEGTATWVLVAWIDFFDPEFRGKPIKDADGNVIGNLVSLDQVTGGQPLGPSMSAPAIDAAGNIWFVSAVALDKVDGNGQPFVDFDTALIRAVYDPASGGYTLERVLEQGFVRQGLNSCTDYQVQFFGVADSNSVSSGTLFSSGITSGTWNNVDNTGFDPADPRNLGGIVLTADITYDVDGDGDFDDPTSTGGDPNSGDESYQVLLYIGNIDKGFGFCSADLDFDGDADADDFFAYLDQFAAGACAADRDFDGDADADDFFAYLDAFAAGC